MPQMPWLERFEVLLGVVLVTTVLTLGTAIGISGPSGVVQSVPGIGGLFDDDDSAGSDANPAAGPILGQGNGATNGADNSNCDYALREMAGIEDKLMSDANGQAEGQALDQMCQGTFGDGPITPGATGEAHRSDKASPGEQGNKPTSPPEPQGQGAGQSNRP